MARLCRMRQISCTSRVSSHAAAKHIPERSAKMVKRGFPVPLDELLRQDEYYETVKAEFTGENAKLFFDTDELMRLLDSHKAGKHNMRKIWMIYSFLLWYKEFFVKR